MCVWLNGRQLSGVILDVAALVSDWIWSPHFEGKAYGKA
jgi:hypothetical protein